MKEILLASLTAWAVRRKIEGFGIGLPAVVIYNMLQKQESLIDAIPDTMNKGYYVDKLKEKAVNMLYHNKEICKK